MRVYEAPSPDEIEVSVFGPRYGECIVIHIGESKWIVVDSCLYSSTEQPVALYYLQEMGVSTADVQAVVATHWHSDHIRGLAEVIKACENAFFAYPIGLRSEEFMTLVQAFSDGVMLEDPGVEEFYDILTHLLAQRTKISPVRLKPVQVDTLVYQSKVSYKNKDHSCALYALSPSNASVTLALAQLGSLLPRSGQPIGRLISPNPNHLSVVLRIGIGDHDILLGADLQETGQADTGWTAILDLSQARGGKASFYKIPHHGSRNADNQRIWKEMLLSDPISVVTPFNRGRVKLPTEEDVERIHRNTRFAYSTSRFTKRKPRLHGAVERTLKEAGIELKPLHPPFGHVRARKKITSADNKGGRQRFATKWATRTLLMEIPEWGSGCNPERAPSYPGSGCKCQSG